MQYLSDKLSLIFSVLVPSEPEWQSCISWWNHVHIQYGRLNLTKICCICPLYHRKHTYSYSAETGKFRGSPQNSAFRGKLWSLSI